MSYENISRGRKRKPLFAHNRTWGFRGFPFVEKVYSVGSHQNSRKRSLHRSQSSSCASGLISTRPENWKRIMEWTKEMLYICSPTLAYVFPLYAINIPSHGK
ncbi:hypothetical protein VPH35_104025 [Triticum aestivum]